MEIVQATLSKRHSMITHRGSLAVHGAHNAPFIPLSVVITASWSCV